MNRRTFEFRRNQSQFSVLLFSAHKRNWNAFGERTFPLCMIFPNFGNRVLAESDNSHRFSDLETTNRRHKHSCRKSESAVCLGWTLRVSRIRVVTRNEGDSLSLCWWLPKSHCRKRERIRSSRFPKESLWSHWIRFLSDSGYLCSPFGFYCVAEKAQKSVHAVPFCQNQ